MSWLMDAAEPKDTVQGGRGHCKGLSRKAIDAGMKETWHKDGATVVLYRNEKSLYCLDIDDCLDAWTEAFDTLTEAQSAASYYRRNH